MTNIKQIAPIIRWAARTWSVLSIAFILFMIGGHLFGSEPQNINGNKDLLSLLFFPTGVLVGLFLAWKWEGFGGLVTIFSILGLFILRTDLIFNPMITGLAAPGLLFVLYWLLSCLTDNDS